MEGLTINSDWISFPKARQKLAKPCSHWRRTRFKTPWLHIYTMAIKAVIPISKTQRRLSHLEIIHHQGVRGGWKWTRSLRVLIQGKSFTKTSDRWPNFIEKGTKINLSLSKTASFWRETFRTATKTYLKTFTLIIITSLCPTTDLLTQCKDRATTLWQISRSAINCQSLRCTAPKTPGRTRTRGRERWSPCLSRQIDTRLQRQLLATLRWTRWNLQSTCSTC